MIPNKFSKTKVGKASTLRHLCVEEFEQTLVHNSNECGPNLTGIGPRISPKPCLRRKSLAKGLPPDNEALEVKTEPFAEVEVFQTRHYSKLRTPGNETITALAVARDGRRYAFGTLKKEGDLTYPLKFVSLGEDEERETFNPETDVVQVSVHINRITGLDFNEDGNQLAACDMSGDIRIYDTCEKPPQQIALHNHERLKLLCISFVFNQKRNVQCLTCGSESPDPRVLFFELEPMSGMEQPSQIQERVPSYQSLPLNSKGTGTETEVESGSGGGVTPPPVSSATGGMEGEWNFDRCITIDRSGNVSSVVLMPDNRPRNKGGMLLAVGGHDHNISIYVVLMGEDSRIERTRPTLKRQNNSFFRTNKGSNEFVHDVQKRNSLIVKGACIYSLNVGIRVLSMCASGDGKTLVIGGGNCASVLKYNTFNFIDTDDSVVHGMKTVGKMIARGLFENEKPKYMREFSDWEETLRIESEGEVHSVSVSYNGECFMIGSYDKTAKLYHTETGALLREMNRPARVSKVALNENGKFAIVGAFDAQVIRYNTEGGLEPYCYIQEGKNKAVQSVDISGDGLSILMCSIGEIAVYDLKTSRLKNRVERRDEDGAMVVVYCGELTHKGDYVFAGGYDNLVIGYQLCTDSRDCKEVVRIQTSGFVWGLSIREEEIRKQNDCWVMLAIGSWDKTASTYKLYLGGDKSGDKVQVEQANVFHHADRVFSTDISCDGRYLAVGTRDRKAVVYDLDPPDPDYPKVAEFRRNERVYCVSLSNDGRLLAVGDVENLVAVYDLTTRKEINCWQRGGKIHDVEWSPNNKILAAGGEDYKVVLYCLQRSGILLELPLEGVCWDLSMCVSSGALVCSSGSQVVMYGEPEHGYGMQDRPSFQMAETLLYDKKALKTAIQSHPTIVNSLCPDTKKTLLQLAVEKNMIDQARIILSGGCVPGALLYDKRGQTALYIAVKNKSKQMLHLLFDGITQGHIIRAPATFECFYQYVRRPKRPAMTLFEDIGKFFPDILLKFIEKISEELCEESVLGGLNQAPIDHTIFIGLPMFSPRHFWEKYFELEKTKSTERRRSSIRRSFIAKGALMRQDSEDEYFEDDVLDTQVELAVEASRLPFPGICQKFKRTELRDGMNTSCSRRAASEKTVFQKMRLFPAHDLSEYRNKSPLEVIIKAANQMKDYSVFKDGTIAARMIQYKWATIKRYFHIQCYLYLVYLVMVCMLANGIANTIELPLAEVWYDGGWGKAALFLVMPIFCCALGYLYQEMEQLAFSAEGKISIENRVIFQKMLKSYFGSIENIIDLTAFVLQAIVCICFLARARGTQSIAAIAVVLQFFKILFYARGWDDWGPLVRIVDRTYISMIPFLGVMIIIVFGFAMAFKILQVDNENFEEFERSMLQVSLLVYGDFRGFNDILTPEGSETNALTILFFEWFMLVIVIILLNLLIAIMNDTYSEVSSNATLEHRMQLATIILEVENGSSFCRSEMRLYPKWVHMLKPISTLEPDEKTEWQHAIEKLVDLSKTHEKRFDELNLKLQDTLAEIHKVQVMQLKYDSEPSAGSGF